MVARQRTSRPERFDDVSLRRVLGLMMNLRSGRFLAHLIPYRVGYDEACTQVNPRFVGASDFDWFIEPLRLVLERYAGEILLPRRVDSRPCMNDRVISWANRFAGRVTVREAMPCPWPGDGMMLLEEGPVTFRGYLACEGRDE